MASSALVDLVCLTFAAWTLLCHAAVYFGASLRQLSAAAALLALAGLLRASRAGSLRDAARKLCGTRAFQPEGRGEAWLWPLAAVCALAVAVARRPDSDDCLYLGFAAGMAAEPGLPVLGADTLYGIPGLPMLLEVYRVHSIEALYAATAWLSGLPAIAVSHLALAPVWGALVPLAYARLFRLLDARRWLLGTLAAALFLILDGGAHGGFGNLAFVRLFQGKAVFLSVFLPLILAYALRFALAPSLLHWVLLAAALIGAVGATGNALWAGPLLAGLALASVWRPNLKATATALAGLAACAYPLALALALRADVHAGVSANLAFAAGRELELLRGTLGYVLGGGWQAAALLAAPLLAAAAWRAGLGAGLSAWLSLGFILLFNPLSGPWAALNVTSPSNYYRVFWILPFPVFVGLAAIAAARRTLRPAARPAARAAAAAVLLAALFPTRLALSRANGTTLGLPALKVPDEYPLIGMLNAALPERRVAAPVEVSQWLVTQERHAYPLLVKDMPFDSLSRRIGPDAVADRARLMAHLGGGRPARLPSRALADAVPRYGLEGAVFDAGLPWAGEIRATLEEARFYLKGSLYGYEVWGR
ncbi:MAG: hypothetical protein HYZ75_16615 [Elusimicrobia bacterium]|nr:hypothetical protein [Elusimicrobiota bacterium]